MFKLIVTLLAMTFILSAASREEELIFGKITTIDSETFSGEIRWGGEEAFWTDIFNSTKTENEHVKSLSEKEIRELKKKKRSWSFRLGEFSIKNTDFGFDFDDNDISAVFNHTFGCRFGDIKSLVITGRRKVEVELKNGEILKLKGGSNDIGAKVALYDHELGEMEFKWKRIERIDFLPTPSELEHEFGLSLYGKVETDEGDFEGFVQWDHDERLTTDKLDGENRNGELSVEFGKIKSINKLGKGVKVLLNSGREIMLKGTNDVNSDNRGVIVTIPGVGRVDITWDDFRKVTFQEDYDSKLSAVYTDFKKPRRLAGSVKAKNEKLYAGLLVFDLDELWDFELLQGKDDDIEYIIPFRNIKKIKPKNYNYSSIELKNGKSVVLGDMQDVSDNNDGILIYEDDGDPAYVAWEDIVEIEFK